MYNSLVLWKQVQRNVLERQRQEETNMVVNHIWHKHILCCKRRALLLVQWKGKCKPLLLAVGWWWRSTCEEMVTSFCSFLSSMWHTLQVGAPVHIDTNRQWLYAGGEHGKHCFIMKDTTYIVSADDHTTLLPKSPSKHVWVTENVSSVPVLVLVN